MSESTATAEKVQEADQISDRAEELYRLGCESLSDILKTKSADSAKEALFEFTFYILGIDNLRSNESRLRNYETRYVDYDVANLLRSKEAYDDILKGDWVKAKKEALTHLTGSDILWSAKEHGLDEGFKYNGVNIFYDEPQPTSSEVDEAQLQFVKEKVNLIPDITEPYEYPRMEELKSKVEVAS